MDECKSFMIELINSFFLLPSFLTFFIFQTRFFHYAWRDYSLFFFPFSLRPYFPFVHRAILDFEIIILEKCFDCSNTLR